jgi:itaconate CoA-transferase
VWIGRPEMAGDELFENNSRRIENREVLEEEISTVFRGIFSEEAIEKLERAGIANARLRSVGDFLDHPQLQARDRWREVGSPAGTLHALLPPATMSGASPVMAPIPEVGEHTGRILSELGYDETSMTKLRHEEAVGC